MKDEKICPICNQLAVDVREQCPRCSSTLENIGAATDFYDPYSGYEESTLADSIMDSADFCLHRFSCPNCGYEATIRINRVSPPDYMLS